MITPDSTSNTDQLDPLTSRVLQLRTDRSIRSALRRAAHPRTRHYALPYIGYLNRGVSDEATFRFAALCAEFDHVHQSTEVSAGRAFRRGDPDRGGKDSPIARRLFAVQRQPLARADSTLRGLLRLADPAALDWNDLLWVMRLWDHPDLTRRVRARQRLIEDFYSLVPPTPDPTEGPSS